MSRWDYDTVFYRVFCITLLGVALTFTVILTNVFVDIDGILTNKKVPDVSSTVPTNRPGLRTPHSRGDQSEDFYEEKDYQDSSDLYRSKRALGTQDLLLQIKDPAVKKILTNRLNTLLDELDEEESIQEKGRNNNDNLNENNNNKNTKTDNVSKINKYDSTDFKEFMKQVLANEKLEKHAESIQVKEKRDDNVFKADNKNKDEMLHLAMHNIILQGIIGNMKMENVYKKVYEMVINFEKHKSENQNEDTTETKHIKAQNSEELKLFDELINCKDLQKEIVTESNKKLNQDSKINKDLRNIGQHNEDPNVIIKTIIDITSPIDISNSENVLSKANLNGIVKLVYNGKSIKFKRTDEPSPATPDISQITTETTNVEEKLPKDGETNKEKLYKKIIQNYLKHISKDSTEHDKVYTRKRLKRHVKIKYQAKQKPKHKNDEDKLYVDIETHFDSHGTKGEEKKKVIRDLIDKIKRAIHSDSVRKPKHLHVKKRTQSRLDNTAFVNSIIVPLGTINHRHINPISKLVVTHEKGPIADDDDFRKHRGPGFLVKNINSAELSTVDIEYDKIDTNGIPQRLQIPLNNDLSEETQSGTNILDLGNAKFLVKDIKGSGFSIGFNQFQGESPDPESMKFFTGLENVIQSYHQQYDQEVTDNPNFDNDERNDNNERSDDNDRKDYYDRNKENADRDVTNVNRNNDNIDSNDNYNINNDKIDVNRDNENLDSKHEHVISRRSIPGLNQSHHHLKEYNIFRKNLLPYENYEDITNKGNMYGKNKDIKLNSLKGSLLGLDENVFDKDLRPAEIFKIADLFARRKRSVKVKKITNINKNKLNKYINTKSMAARTLFQNNKKRTKRQIDKIRIVARDSMGQHRVQNSEEGIFVLSDEKVYADRAVLTELVPEYQKVPFIKHFGVIAPEKMEENRFDVREPKNDLEFNPYVYEVQNHQNPYPKLTPLMSKYPHIFMEEASKEEFPFRRQDSVESTTVPKESNFKELPDLVPQDKANFKVTVKIRPKNATTNGFKEIHTSINKTYHKNGVLYTSLVNVSEVSKIENLHKNDTRKSQTNLKEQQQILKNLLNRHKSRIEEQLKHLNLERRILNELNIQNVEPNEILNLGVQISSTTEKITETTKKAQISTTISTTVKPTTETTTEKIVVTTRDPDKIKLLTKLDRNAHLTSEILKKIDKNTGILEIFLDKVLKNMYSVTVATTTQKMETNTPLKAPFNYENKNNENSKIDVPFAYSYQSLNPNNIQQEKQQIVNYKQNNSNNNYFKNDLKEDLKKEPFFQPKPGEMVINNYILKNNTRFYLDALGEQYSSKMVPLASKSHTYNTPYSIPNNATII